jgi:hypothetical protein
MICQDLIVEGTDEVFAEVLDVIDLCHIDKHVLDHVDIRLKHFGLNNGSGEFLPSECAVRQRGTYLVYDKADNIICFCIAVTTVNGQPVSEMPIGDILSYDFRVIFNFFCVISFRLSLIGLFNSRFVENRLFFRRRNDRGFITKYFFFFYFSFVIDCPTLSVGRETGD